MLRPIRKVKNRKNRFSVNSQNLLYTIFCESTVFKIIVCVFSVRSCNVTLFPIYVLCIFHNYDIVNKNVFTYLLTMGQADEIITSIMNDNFLIRQRQTKNDT